MPTCTSTPALNASRVPRGREARCRQFCAACSAAYACWCAVNSFAPMPLHPWWSHCFMLIRSTARHVALASLLLLVFDYGFRVLTGSTLEAAIANELPHRLLQPRIITLDINGAKRGQHVSLPGQHYVVRGDSIYPVHAWHLSSGQCPATSAVPPPARRLVTFIISSRLPSCQCTS